MENPFASPFLIFKQREQSALQFIKSSGTECKLSLYQTWSWCIERWKAFILTMVIRDGLFRELETIWHQLSHFREFTKYFHSSFLPIEMTVNRMGNSKSPITLFSVFIYTWYLGEEKRLWLVYIHMENKGMGLMMLLIL